MKRVKRGSKEASEGGEKGAAWPWSSPDSAAGGGVGVQMLICSSHTEPCCRCLGPEITKTYKHPYYCSLIMVISFRSCLHHFHSWTSQSHIWNQETNLLPFYISRTLNRQLYFSLSSHFPHSPVFSVALPRFSFSPSFKSSIHPSFLLTAEEGLGSVWDLLAPPGDKSLFFFLLRNLNLLNVSSSHWKTRSYKIKEKFLRLLTSGHIQELQPLWCSQYTGRR